MRKRYTFDEIMRMDNALLQVAIYETTNGSIFVPKTPEEMAEFQIKSSQMFNYFKNMIRLGEITLDELKEKVSNKWGPVKQNNVDPDNGDELIKDIEEENIDRESEQQAVGHIQNILKAIFSEQPIKTLDQLSREGQITELQHIGNPFTVRVDATAPASVDAKSSNKNPKSSYNSDNEQPPKSRKTKKPRKSK
jgi:hypothetical protein